LPKFVIKAESIVTFVREEFAFSSLWIVLDGLKN